MKLLFDQNLSHRLVDEVDDLFPGSSHVRAVGLSRASDQAVWAFAASRGYVLVSKDADFRSLSTTRFSPPKVIWIRVGNSTTDQIAALIRHHAADLIAFEIDPDAVFLALGRRQ